MLKLFFNRSSPLVYLMNGLALVGILYLLYPNREGATVASLGPLSGFLILTWLFFNFINWVPWYPGTKGKLGIRLHFQKNIVPLAYLMVLVLTLKLMGFSEWVLLPFVILVLPMYYVSVILLSFHFRDHSELTPGYFSHNFYLKEEESSCTQ